MKAPWYTKLEKLGACFEAIEYAKTQPSCAAAWRNCERGDSMLWVLGRNGTDRKKLVLAAVAYNHLLHTLMRLLYSGVRWSLIS